MLAARRATVSAREPSDRVQSASGALMVGCGRWAVRRERGAGRGRCASEWNCGTEASARSRPIFVFRPTLPSLALAPMAALWARAKEAVGLADDVEEQATGPMSRLLATVDEATTLDRSTVRARERRRFHPPSSLFSPYISLPLAIHPSPLPLFPSASSALRPACLSASCSAPWAPSSSWCPRENLPLCIPSVTSSPLPPPVSSSARPSRHAPCARRPGGRPRCATWARSA